MASPQPPYRPPNPNALAGNMQNLQIGSRPPPPSARPPPFGSNGPISGPPGPGSAPIAQSPFSSGGPPGPQRPGGPQLGSQRPVGAPQMNPVGVRSVGSPPGPPPGSQPQFSSGPRAAQPGSQPPFGGPPGATRAPPFSGPPGTARAAPFSGPPGASQTPFSGPPGASQTPFSGPPGASHTPFSGPPGASQTPFSGPPGASQTPFSGPPGASHTPFSGPPGASQPPFARAPLTASQSPFSGGPPAVSQPPFAGGPPMGSQPPFAGGQMASQPPSVRGPPPPFAGGPPVGSQPPIAGGSTGATMQFGGMHPSQPFPGQPKTMQQFPGAVPAFQGTPSAGAPYGSPPMWGAQGQQGTQEMPGAFQPPPRMYSMPGQAPIPPMMGQTSLPGSQVSTPSKIDPNQIPRPMPSSSILEFETRQGGQANIPPPAASDFIARDCGNCSPRYMRCTIHQVPCTGDLLSTSGMPLSLLVQPFALPHPSEEPIQVVDFGESGPVRCSRCKGYINPFMKFIDQGRHFICNLCGFTDDTPREYHCNLGPDGRRRDADERPELCRGTVEFVATKEYMVRGRDPMPAVFFFLIDVSRNALQTGATAAACSAINQAIADLPEGPRTLVGVATFDSAIHFYNLKRSLQQPLMLIVPDVQDVYTPLQTDLIVPVTECREHLEQLLENIPSMFENNKVAESASGAAMQAAFLAMKPTGGKLLVFQSVLPSIGVGSLSSREAEGRSNISSAEKEVHKLLQPADKTLRTMAIDFAEYQVCVDMFITAQTYVDIASLGVVPKTTGGQVYYYYPFSALSDSAKLYNDLRWNVTRPQGFEAVMRVRCSQGLELQEYFGNFCKRVPTDIDLPAIDCDKTIMVTFKHDDKFQEGTECAFQCAVLYTTVFGQRRIRVSNLSLPCTSMLSNLFRSADLDSQFASFLKQAANEIPTSPLPQVRDHITNLCIGILHSYRKYCATVSSSGQLILPEALKLLPLYTLALIKSIGLRTDGRSDDRSYWVNHVATLSTTLCVPLVYPRMIAVHDLTSKEDDGSLVPYTVPLSSEHVTDDGIFLMENGEDVFILVGNSVDPTILQQIFGASSIDAIPSLLVLEQYDNELSKKLNDVVNEIRRQRCSYLRLHVCKKGEPSGMLFFSYMIEDKTPGGLSYVEFLVHVHRQIQTKMA